MKTKLTCMTPSPATPGIFTVFALAGGLMLSNVNPVQAQVLFSDDFDGYAAPSTVTAAGVTNGYKILFGAASGPSDFKAVFGFDYSTVTSPGPIPSAPSSIGGTTKGLLLTVNKDATGAAAAVNLYPTNQTFTGNFSVTFDIWMNYVVNPNSTEHALFGINHTGNVTNRVGQAGSDGLFFAMSAEGGSSSTSSSSRDYSVFRGGGTATPVLMTGAALFGPTPPLGANFDNADAGFAALFPSSAGTPGNMWVQGEVRQETNVVTWLLNNTIVAQYTNTFAYGSGDILLGYNDIFASIGDPNSFVIFDNIKVTSLGGLPVVSVTAPTPLANETGLVAGKYTITRSSTSGAVTVNYLMSGTASNGLDYVTLPGSVTLPSGVASTNITLTPIADGISEPIETAILTLQPGAGYTVSSPIAATVTILDGDAPKVSLSTAQPILLEGVSAASVTMTLTRVGLTNSALSVGIGYSGTATLGADYAAPATVALAAGAITTTFKMTPIDDNLIEGNETAIVTVLNGTNYQAVAPSAVTNTIVDDEILPGVPIFADAFNSVDAGTNWTVSPYSGDTYADFGYDYSVDGIPEAPSSSGAFAPRRGLKMRANEVSAAVAGISASPANADFEGNYRLRFDLFMSYSGPLNNASVPGQTQAAEAGVGVSGTQTVWPLGFEGQGIWFTTTGDGGNAAVTGDYNAYGGNVPFGDTSEVYAAGTTNGPRDNVNPYYAPWPAVTAPPAMVSVYTNQTGSTGVGSWGLAWHKHVITKRGTVVSWDVDGRRVAAVDASTNGVTLANNVFVGYYDPYLSVTTNATTEFGLFDNVRVESLGRPLIGATAKTGATVNFVFLGEDGDQVADFDVQAAGLVAGPYTGIAATITKIDATHFAVSASSASGSFFRVRRL
jgi:hypothetical protein